MSEDVKNYIDNLQKRTKAKVFGLLDLLSRFENKLGMPYSKKIGKDLYELKIRSEQEIRIFYTFKKDRIVLFHSFAKKKNKTPLKELKTGLKKFWLSLIKYNVCVINRHDQIYKIRRLQKRAT